MRSKGSRILKALATGATALAYAAYRKDINEAKKRIEAGRQFLETEHGPIEFAAWGDGPPVLIIHGAGGGFDQGLDLGRVFVGDHHRLIAPSRFGYLGTPLPDDASPEAQADAHLRVLDELRVERVPVVGVSAGAPSAMQLCLRHPERCSLLVLVVPLAYTPLREPAAAPSPFFQRVLNVMAASDFLYWTAMHVARRTLVKTILGTPVEVFRNATNDQRKDVDRMLRSMLPMSSRVTGIANDGIVASNLTRYALETMHVPTLVISAADDLYGTYESGLYTAEQIHDGEFVGFPTGGHLLLGHDEEVRSHFTGFLKQRLEAQTAMAG